MKNEMFHHRFSCLSTRLIWLTQRLIIQLGAVGTQTQETPNRTKGLILYKLCAARANPRQQGAQGGAALLTCGKAADELYKIKILYN